MCQHATKHNSDNDTILDYVYFFELDNNVITNEEIHLKFSLAYHLLLFILQPIIIIKENELLAQSIDPQKTYIEDIMPAKLKLNEKYLKNPTVFHDLKIIFKTFTKILMK